MNRQEVIEKILLLCDTEDGFLVPLRCRREFSEDKYTQLVSAIKSYGDMIEAESVVDKQIAACLHDLVFILNDMMTAFPRNEDEASLIRNAAADCASLVAEVFSPELKAHSM